MDLSLTARPGHGCVVIEVGGVLDLATVPDVRGILQDVIDDGAVVVVLDLTGVRLLDSTALGMIVWLYKQLQERSGDVRVVATKPTVLRVFELTSVDRLIPIYDTVEAVESELRTGSSH